MNISLHPNDDEIQALGWVNAVFVQPCSSDAAGSLQQEVDIEHREPECSVSAGLVHYRTRCTGKRRPATGFATRLVCSSSRSSLEDSVPESQAHTVQAEVAGKGLLLLSVVKSC